MNKLIKKLDNVPFQVRNILDIYRQGTDAEIISGKQWYNQANEITGLMSAKYSLTHVQTAGIVAALSPGTSWSQNIIDANNFCSLLNVGKDIRSITVTTYGNNKNKAYQIYYSPELSENQVYKLLLGASKTVNKTSSFYLNILHPDRDEHVTIDRHSFRVNLGITESPVIALTEKRYRIMSQAYKQAAKQVKVNPIELQAITWLIFRRLYVKVRLQEFEEAPF